MKRIISMLILASFALAGCNQLMKEKPSQSETFTRAGIALQECYSRGQKDPEDWREDFEADCQHEFITNDSKRELQAMAGEIQNLLLIERDMTWNQWYSGVLDGKSPEDVVNNFYTAIKEMCFVMSDPQPGSLDRNGMNCETELLSNALELQSHNQK